MNGYELEILAGLGIFFGCFARSFLPFLRKKAESAKSGQGISWEGRYTWTLLFDATVAIIATMFLLPMFRIPTEFVFPGAFIFGWASQDVVNKIAK